MNCRWRQPPDLHKEAISPEGGTRSCAALRADAKAQPIPVAHATGSFYIVLRTKS